MKGTVGVSEGRGGGTALRLELKRTDLASLPSPAELQAITMALGQVLGMVAPVRRAGLSPQPTAWRFGGRWWARAPGASDGLWRY